MSSRPSRGAARLAAILDALPDALLLVNRNGTVVNANAMALEALEAPGTPIVGRGLLDLLPTFDRSRIPGSVRAMDSMETRTKPTRMTARRTDGSLLPVEVTSANLPGAYDDELLMIVVRDLTGSVDVESELQRQQRQTEMILRAATEGIVGIDAEGLIVLVNPAAARILRHRAGDLGGRSLHELLMPKRADGTELPADECPPLVTLKSGRKQRLRDQVLWRGDGECLPVEMTTAPILLGEAVVGAVMTFTDLSRERALAEHREQLAELLDGELLARVEASRAKLKTLADGSIGELGPSARRVVRQVAGELEEMAGLATELLEHQSGEKKDTERSAATVDDLLDRALETVTYPARAAGVEFTVTAAPVGVQVDVDAMTRALGHLIADTVGAGPKGATVVVAAAQRGKVARIEVRGPAARGSSVHVPLARAVIEAHGGTVESHKVEGRGSTYVVELPADDEAAAKARPQDGAEAGADRARARKRARTSPAIRPGTTAPGKGGNADAAKAKQAEQPDKPADSAAKPDGDGKPAPSEADASADTAAETPSANDRDNALPAVRSAAALEPATPALPAPARPIALPAGESAQAAEEQPGSAPSVPLVPASGGRRAARRALAIGPGEQTAEDRSGDHAEDHPEDSQGPGDLPPSGHDANEEHPQDPSAAPGVPTKVNGHHTRHMARARHQLTTPPASIPAQSRPTPGVPGRSTSVQDRADAPPELAPTELLELPPAPSPIDADAQTALMPQIPAPPGEASPANPQAPQAIPPAPGAPPPALGRRRRALAPEHQSAEHAAAAPQTPAPQLPELEVPGQGSPSPYPLLPSAYQGNGGLPGQTQDPLPQRTPGALPHPGNLREPGPAAPPQQDPRHFPHQSPEAGAPALPQFPSPGVQAVPPYEAHGFYAPEMDTPPPGELAAMDPDYPPMVAPAPDGRPRRLLVWPSPDGPTSGALTARGWDPVLVRSREEVDANASAHPAALFVDPLTGPITRTALQSLRTAATSAEIPVLVTAGLMQATRDAAFGADPAVLLRSLAPADSAHHASRVLLVEANPDIAAAFTASLMRRGMDVVHVTSESEAVSKASSVEPNLVVLDLMLVRRRRLGIVDWLRNNQRLHSTPIVVYTTVDIAPEDSPRLRTGETVLFLAERSTREDVQQRVVDLLGKIASLV